MALFVFILDILIYRREVFFIKGKSHFACGVITGVGCATALLYINNSNINEAVTLASVSAFSSLLPDIDMPNSKLGKKIKPLSYSLNKLFGHRTFTHSGLWLILLAFLLAKFFSTPYSYIILGLFIGFLSHVLSDTLTRGGVPWLWPMSRKRYHVTNINSGEKDGIFIVLTSSLLITSFYFVLTYVFPIL